MIYIIFSLIRPFSEPLWSVYGGDVILEESAPIKIEMFHNRIKVICKKKKNFKNSVFAVTIHAQGTS